MWCKGFLVGLLITISVLDLACGRWCTRLVKKHHVETDFVMTKCTQPYQARCTWFSNEMCTFNDTVDCLVQNNRTVEGYFIAEECCPGYMLDPINNITCIKENNELQEELTTTESVIEKHLPEVPPACSTKMCDGGSMEINFTNGQLPLVGGLHDSLDDSTIFGLSHGAYAGIVCTLMFFTCVIILVVWHVLKRKRNAKSKENKLEMSVTDKMIPVHT